MQMSSKKDRDRLLHDRVAAALLPRVVEVVLESERAHGGVNGAYLYEVEKSMRVLACERGLGPEMDDGEVDICTPLQQLQLRKRGGKDSTVELTLRAPELMRKAPKERGVSSSSPDFACCLDLLLDPQTDSNSASAR